MNICVVGAGMQGKVGAMDLINAGHRVTVLDNNIDNLKQVKKISNIRIRKFNVKATVKFIRLIKGFDIIVGALPAALGFYTMECALEAGVDLVDISYAPEDPFLLHKRANKKRIRIVPDAGFAPGLSNIFIGEAYQELGGINNLRILVGGIPQNPQPPFNYRITWSPADLIEEYTRPTRIIKNYKIISAETLGGIEGFKVPKIGRLECFYTDGLRTLLKTMKNVRNMEEKTIRYPGHAKLFKTIFECGFLSNQPVHYGTSSIKARDFNIEFLRRILSSGDEKDLSILMIQIKKGNSMRKYTCIDYYDEKNRITSMARMTAYTGSIITQCIKHYPNFGIIPPEYLGMEKNLCRFIKTEIKKRNIIVRSKQVKTTG